MNLKSMQFPIYLPDATRGVVRSLDSQDLKQCGIEALVVCTYHLMNTPGIEVLDKAGGLKKFMNWDGFIVSDSGGFQIMSLLHTKRTKGKITDEGIYFQWERSGRREDVFLTPEKSIEMQFSIGADIMICLDDFAKPDATDKELTETVRKTVLWAARSKAEFERQCEIRHLEKKNRPLLLAVLEGGDSKKLRKECALQLIETGFDAYGYGGWPMNKEGKLDEEILSLSASLLPNDKPKFALGVGKPEDIVKCFAMGYTMFDCVLPTRDARHERLYIFEPASDQPHQQMYITREVFKNDTGPISPSCDCHTCKNYSRGYLYHLFKIKETLAYRLATIHNLRTYMRVIEHLRKQNKDFLSSRGILKKYALKGKSIQKVIELEKEAAAQAVADEYIRSQNM